MLNEDEAVKLLIQMNGGKKEKEIITGQLGFS